MSFAVNKTIIEEEDTVMLYISINKLYAVVVQPKIKSKNGTIVENVIQFTPYGALRVRDLIGKKYGTKINLSGGWAYVLQPTAELWTLTLPHRTQIIYTPDISMIVMQLELVPGSVVIESGTGSGSLTHALIRAVRPSGHVHTFDFHQVRCETASEEFTAHGLGDNVTVRHQDVCQDGFTSDLNGKAHAVFLDLPIPWLAIPHAVKAMRNEGGRLCTFSPCIEQVQKSCETLHNYGFEEIRTLEVMQTQYSVQYRTLPVLTLDYLKVAKSEGESSNIKDEKKITKVLAVVPPQSQTGHTGYLTFATLLPIWVRNQNSHDN